jgi:hypothetical protein
MKKGSNLLTFKPLGGRPVCIPQLGKDDAVIAINIKGQRREVQMTALIAAFPRGGDGLRLKYVHKHDAKKAWDLPLGVGRTDSLRTDGYEVVEGVAEVLARVMRPESVLASLRRAKPQMPPGFTQLLREGGSPLSSVLIEFDANGAPCLHLRRGYDQAVLGCFGNYASALNSAWPRINGKDFEAVMRLFFERLGFSVEQTQLLGGPDGGVDLTIRREDPILGDDSCVVQCKNLATTNVGGPDVLQLRGAAQNAGAQRAVFVTTSGFPAAARTAAQGQGIPVQLIDGAALAKLILPYVKDIELLRDALTGE